MKIKALQWLFRKTLSEKQRSNIKDNLGEKLPELEVSYEVKKNTFIMPYYLFKELMRKKDEYLDRKVFKKDERKK